MCYHKFIQVPGTKTDPPCLWRSWIWPGSFAEPPNIHCTNLTICISEHTSTRRFNNFNHKHVAIPAIPPSTIYIFYTCIYIYHHLYIFAIIFVFLKSCSRHGSGPVESISIEVIANGHETSIEKYGICCSMLFVLQLNWCMQIECNRFPSPS